MLLILCGFMGCGKTSKGKILAQTLGIEYCDLDELVVKNTGKTIKEIFDEAGEKGFRKIESETLSNVINKNIVLSLGGGTLDKEINRSICADSTVIYLDTPYDICYQRICNTERPLVKLKTGDELKELYTNRTDIYRACADIVIETANFNEDKNAVVAEIIRQLNNIGII